MDRVVEPYGLVTKAGTWYLLARIEEQMRVYRISRIEESEILPESFRREAGFDLERAWAERVAGFQPHQVVQVEVRAGDVAAALMARVAGDNLSRRDTGGRLRLEFPGVDAAAGFLAGFGGSIEVISPPELRQRLEAIGRQLVGMYEEARDII